LRCRPLKLSRRQKRRRYEERYWDNVYLNALKKLDRRRARKERELEAIFEEYKGIVAKEREAQLDESDAPRASADETCSGFSRFICPTKKLCFRSGQPRSSPIRPPAERFREVCLIDSLRAHRYKVQYTADGPFWAMADGNKFLRPWQNLCRFHIFVFLKFFTLFDQ
jgi:hypothetical protein